MKKITTYIPCYIWNKKDFYDWLWKTLDSIKLYSHFSKIKLFICQKECRDELNDWCIKNDIKNFNIVFILEKEAMYLPIRTFEYMQNDKEVNDADYLFYLEWDHILHIKDDFFEKIFEQLDKWNIVMPHRLWKTKFENRKYLTHKWFYVWNYQRQWIIKYNDDFEIMKNYNIFTNRNHNDYAWCYFTNKKTILWLSQKLKYNKYIWKLHFFWLFNHFWLPYSMKLEYPSLILALHWKKILKSKDIDNCRVEHLSKNWYV